MKPYLRSINTWIQSKKFDLDCEYMKQFIPELKDFPVKDIHTWHESWQNIMVSVSNRFPTTRAEQKK